MASLTDRIKQLRQRVARDISRTGDEGRKQVDRVQAERERARVEARREAQREFLEEQRDEAREEARQERLEELRREQMGLQERVAERARQAQEAGGRAAGGLGRIADAIGGEDRGGRRSRRRKPRGGGGDTDPLFGAGELGTDEDVIDPLGASDGIEAGNIEFFDSTDDDGDPPRYF